MYIAMNRFRIVKGQEEAFEAIWKARDSHLSEVPGFVEFHLLRGPEAEDHTVYVSHTIWESAEAFAGWTRSEAFRKAHANAGAKGGGGREGIYQGPPRFEGFQSVQTTLKDGTKLDQ